MALTEKYVSVAGGGTHDGTSEANAFTWAEMLTDSATSADGTRYNIKTGTYSRTTTDTPGGGSNSGPLIFRGYNTTIGDGYLGRTNDNGALITTNMPLISYSGGGRLNMGNSSFILESLRIQATGLNGSTVTVQPNSITTRCAIQNISTGVSVRAMSVPSTGAVVDNCDIYQESSSGVSAISCGACYISRNRIKSLNGIGIESTSASFIYGNVIYQCGAAGVNVAIAGSNSSYITQNTIVGNTGDGININASSTAITYVTGNMITDNGGWGIDTNGTASATIASYNRLRDNTSGNYSSADWLTATGYGDVTTDTGGPSTDYVDATTQDYKLVAAGAGVSASLQAFASMGALQRSQLASLAPSPLISTLIQGNGPNK